MTAETALRMGCPIYGVVAATNTATDKQGRSIPAPGQGILTTARRTAGGPAPRCLDAAYRVEQLRAARAHIRAWYEAELGRIAALQPEPAQLVAMARDAQLEAERRLAAERRHWGHEFAAGDARVAPLEAALAVFGLGVDDIAVASFHGTGTKANDTNESAVLQRQLEHLGRTRGNMLPAVCQKYLTGHPKGAAAAWMLNGMLQCMNAGVVPPNRNADSIEPALRDYGFIFHPARPLRGLQIRACLLKSFGFGQVGGEVLLVHPSVLLGALPAHQRDAYLARRAARETKATQYQLDALLSPQTTPLVQVKTAPPFPAELEAQVYLDPAARAQFDPATGSWVFTKAALDKAARQALGLQLLPTDTAPKGVGVDVQLVADLPLANADFVARNYTAREAEHCRAQPDPAASFAGRWAAKEAVVKALCAASAARPAWLQGAGAPLSAIEVLPGASGAPTVRVEGVDAPLRVSISHSGAYAMAVALVL